MSSIATNVSIGLTQFLDYTFKGSTAKTNTVKKIKYQDDYHPSKDYWKPLRDRIRLYHENNRTEDYLISLIDEISQAKQKNYTDAIKAYLKFFRNKEVKWFEPGKATWYSGELAVRSSPEIGLIIDGKAFLIKLFFKGQKEKVDKIRCRAALTLLSESIFTEEHIDDITYAVLNVQKGKLIFDEKLNDDHRIALQSEAAQFMYIWNKV